MKSITNLIGGAWPQKAIKGAALGVMLIAALAVSAHAADRRGGDRHGAGDRDWRAHEGRVHGYEPGVVYAPPVVYTPPQTENPGLNLIIPLNFR